MPRPQGYTGHIAGLDSENILGSTVTRAEEQARAIGEVQRSKRELRHSRSAR